MKPQKLIAKNLRANINLVPGDSGAEEDLPAYFANGIFTTHWKLSIKERLRLLFKGSIWLNIMAYRHPPVRIDVTAPYEVVKSNIPWGQGQLEGMPPKEQKMDEPPDKFNVEDDEPEFEDEEERAKREEEDRGFFS